MNHPHPEMDRTPPPPKPPQPRGGLWAWMDSRGVTRIIQLVAILSLFLALVVGIRQYTLANCLAQYSDDNARASAERLKAAEQDRKALDIMISAIAGARSVGPEEAQRQVNGALDTYLSSRTEADEQRRRNPPPDPPSERCN